jgi:DNA-binding IclR family transcriptional regulator
VTNGILNRGLAVLELLAGNAAALPIREIAAALKIPASATHRLLSELMQRGYVQQSREHGEYSLTMKLCALGLSQLSRSGVVDMAQPILDQLARVSGEVARLGIVDGEQLVWVAKAQAAMSGLRFDPDMGGIAPLSCTASGHAWLSCLSDEQALVLVGKQGGLGRAGGDLGENAPRTVVELLRHLHKTRSRGFSVLAEAVHIGVAAVAAPVRHIGTGQVMGVLSIAGPHVRLSDKKMARLGPVLIQAAAELGAASAGSPLLRRGAAGSAGVQADVKVLKPKRQAAGVRHQRSPKPLSAKSA